MVISQKWVDGILKLINMREYLIQYIEMNQFKNILPY